MVLTSFTIVLMFSNSSAEIGSYCSFSGHLALTIKPSVQLRFCQIASVTKGAKGWRAIKRVSRVRFNRGTFWYSFWLSKNQSAYLSQIV